MQVGKKAKARVVGAGVYRFAVGGLALVLVLQGAFILLAESRMDAEGRGVEEATRIAADFIVADGAMDDVSRASAAYVTSGSTFDRGEFLAAADRFRAALADVQLHGNHDDDVVVARELNGRLNAHLSLVELVAQQGGATAPGVLDRIDANVDSIITQLAASDEMERQEVVDAVTAQRQTQSMIVKATPLGLAAGFILIGLCAAAIVAYRRSNQAVLRGSEARFRSLVENSSDLILVLGEDRGVTYVSPACTRLLGFTPGEFAALPREDLIHPNDLATFVAARWLSKSEPERVVGPFQMRILHHDDGWRWLEVSLVNQLAMPDVAGLVANCRDVSDVRWAEEELEHSTTHDSLTGLPNRALLIDRIDRAIAHRTPEQSDMSVMVCDIDSFKVLNDSRGHNDGDAILKVVAKRIGAAVRPQDTVARFSGDSFVVCCEGLELDAVVRLAERIRATFTEPFAIDGDEIFLTASVGVRPAAMRGDAAEDLVRDADAAVHHAKAEGRDRVVVYNDLLRAHNEARLTVERDLRHAIERDQLRVHYQPVVSVASGELVGMEALVRWDHPDRGLVPPNDFIGVAEDCGLIGSIGAWVLETACRQLREWQDAGAKVGNMAVNLSGRQLDAPDLLDMVADVVTRTGVDPSDVCLEVTESVIMADPDAAIAKLSALRALGFRIAIDDFGTGYSSLAQLRRFPVDILKIDRSFVTHVGDEPEATAIVTAIIHLARALDLTTVAEGVEHASQRVQLQLLGCDYAQGYHWSRPMPADEIRPWLVIPESITDERRADEPYRVLVVDDDPTIRSSLSRVLEATGKFHVVGDAADGGVAVRVATECHPDLVLLDLSMPNVSGLQALPEIIRTSPKTKVVLISGSMDDGEIPSGASAYLRKGVTPEDLIEELLLVMGSPAPV